MDYVIEYAGLWGRWKIAQTDDGLWFEFIRPISREEQPHDQRLSRGFPAGIGRFVDDVFAFPADLRTLLLEVKADRYTLRAYECWEKGGLIRMKFG
ncbi:MAG: hypothetical protein ACLUN5_02620 [Oscillospiraceae bacterium]